MKFVENREPDETKVCEPCELSKPLRSTRKGPNERALKVGDKIHIDVVRVKPKGINRQH